MLTLNQVIKNLNNIADSHQQINHFFYGEIYDFASSGTVDYPALIVTQEPSTLSDKVLTMSFNLYVADLVHKDISDRQEVLSDTQSILIDVIAILKRTLGYSWNLELNNVRLNDFVDNFDEEVSGWWFNLSLRIPNPLDRCAVPVSGTPAIVEPAPEGSGTPPPYNTLNDNILGAWNFDNDALDAVGSNDGTLVNSPTYGTGKIGQAIDLDGVNQYVSFANNGWDLTSDFTVSLWLNATSTSGTQNLINTVSNQGAQTKGWAIRLINKQIGIITYESGAQRSLLTTSDSPIDAGTWYHVLFQRESGVGCKVYLNNVEILSDSVTFDPNYATTSYNTVGVERLDATTFNGYYDGLIDMPAIWTRLLTSDEKADLYNDGDGKQYVYV